MTIYDYTDKRWHGLKTVKDRAIKCLQTDGMFIGPSIIGQILLSREETVDEHYRVWKELNSKQPQTYYSMEEQHCFRLFASFLAVIDEGTAQTLAREIADKG